MAIKLNITRGKVQRPQKVVVYGPEGIGKTTFASNFPNPLFIDTEGGSAHLDVARIECRESWNDLLETIKEVARQDICKTLVLDTADWAEQLAINSICTKYKQPSIESFGYGKGYTYVSEEIEKMLSAFNEVIESGKHVVITAHAKMRKQELPDEQGAFDRWELKLTRQTAPIVKEWADAVFFLNYKTYVSHSDNGSAKASGGKRVMYTSHHPCWDAKNRYGLEDMLDMDYQNIAEYFSESPVADRKSQIKKINAEGKALKEQLKELMERDGVTEDELKELLSKSKNFDERIPVTDYADKLVPKWDSILSKLGKDLF
ncbi:ATP-binding protein [Succinivibrio dextrinosolvens]|uniref:AAA domain-containing protein n=1 Tax=Succinivibrio dextrinosolvens TaxID=83771 RepID=A0A662Z8G4_9GAMM|nr:ATP-binding protein [Succinivibrio dextrinosolvens]SFJ74867.1 AAA domain-containing protein [Succinivibrio dextrinosolvens]